MSDVPRSLDLRVGEHSYLAVVGPNILESAADYLERAGLDGRLRVVADETAWRLHGARLMEGLHPRRKDAASTTLQLGEEQKDLSTLGRVYDWLLEVGLERRDCVVAFGGGVCGDLVGFAAATALRGVALVQVPTTLLAQVDSSIGGKTGINHPLGKNLIGAFHQPHLVLADTSTLETLPERELVAGWVEVIKMAMTLDPDLFADLEDTPQAFLQLEPEATTRAIARSIELKGAVVAADEREAELRMVLNYGHTIGHAVEAATGYARYLHGEAVAIGMAGAAHIAEQLGVLPSSDRARQDRLIDAFGLPRTYSDLDTEKLWAPMSQDKKARAQQLTWVLATRVGRATIRRDVPLELVHATLRHLATLA